MGQAAAPGSGPMGPSALQSPIRRWKHKVPHLVLGPIEFTPAGLCILDLRFMFSSYKGHNFI